MNLVLLPGSAELVSKEPNAGVLPCGSIGAGEAGLWGTGLGEVGCVALILAPSPGLDGSCTLLLTKRKATSFKYCFCREPKVRDFSVEK